MLTRRDFIRQSITGAAVGAVGLLESIVSEGFSQLNAQQVQSSSQLPSQFEVFYAFGVHEENNFLDTRNNLYVVDMVCDPPKRYQVVLSDSEKKAIYDAVLKNDFFNIKDDLTSGCNDKGECAGQFPDTSATLTIKIEGKTKTIKYKPEYATMHENDPDIAKYKNIVTVIGGILNKRREELNVPRPRCLYG